MSEHQTNWSREELEAYLLFYCANADFIETEEEKKVIHSKVSDKVYIAMHLEFINNNDYARIQKVISTAERFKLSKEEVNILLNEAMQVFESDGKVDVLEKEMFIGLRRVLK